MSSTKRGSKRYDHKNDYYVTPVNVIEELLPILEEALPDILTGTILDPCAGGGY